MGCVNISNRLSSSPNMTELMKAHQASPSHCIEFCRKNQFSWALVSLKRCICFIDNAASVYAVANDSCNERCKSNTSLICGGRDGVGSFYRTGTWAFFFAPFCSVEGINIYLNIVSMRVFILWTVEYLAYAAGVWTSGTEGFTLERPIPSHSNACHASGLRIESNYSKNQISCEVGFQKQTVP